MLTKKRFPVGQNLIIAIPLKSGKEDKFAGQIGWTNDKGIGVRIIKKIKKIGYLELPFILLN